MAGCSDRVVAAACFCIEKRKAFIRGDSATGKTTLLELLDAYDRDGDSSGVLVRSEVPCVVIGGQRWQENLQFVHNSIVFIDECNRFIKSEDFAVSVKGSDNYFVIITRDSVKEIYGIRESGKYAGLKQVYNEFYHLYGAMDNVELNEESVILAEDSNSGFEFFSSVCAKQIQCISK